MHKLNFRLSKNSRKWIDQVFQVKNGNLFVILWFQWNPRWPADTWWPIGLREYMVAMPTGMRAHIVAMPTGRLPCQPARDRR